MICKGCAYKGESKDFLQGGIYICPKCKSMSIKIDKPAPLSSPKNGDGKTGTKPLASRQGTKNDTERGLYGKYRIERMDGSSGPGGKHEHCWCYALDVKHDKHAVVALKAYIESCRSEYPLLAADLEKVLEPRA